MVLVVFSQKIIIIFNILMSFSQNINIKCLIGEQDELDEYFNAHKYL